jgi:hypothetical protein
MLDQAGKTRGMLFTEEQWGYCSGTYRVAKVVPRMLDDSWRMRPISAAVALEAMTCDGVHGTGGCGRSCALLLKVELLEPATEPGAEPAGSLADAAQPRRPRATVRIKTP